MTWGNTRAVPGVDWGPLFLATALGLSSGLVEGVAHMALHRFNVLDNVWYSIIWIAAIFNGLLLAILGVACTWCLTAWPGRARLRAAAVFLLVFAAFLPCTALILKSFFEPYAILVLLLGMVSASTRWIVSNQALAIRLSRSSLPWLGTLTLLAVIGIDGGQWLRERRAAAALPSASPASPNILIVIIDALRSDHLSAYGYKRATSPFIDRLAREGVLFEEAFAVASYTLPSHESMLTGLYPQEHGVEWGTSQGSRANARYPTIAATLQRHGYRTGAFSGNTNYFTREHGFGRGFMHFEDFFHSWTDMAARTAYGRILTTQVLLRLGALDTPGRKTADDTNGALIRWTAANRRQPYFGVVNYFDVHDPYLPPPPYDQRFSTVGAPPGLINQNRTIPDSLSPSELESEINAYDGAIAYVDDRLSELVGALTSQGNGRDLLVILTSDHGEEFDEHKGFIHGNHLYREVIQVPLLLWQPGRVPGGVRISQPVSNAAIPATIMRALEHNSTEYPGPPLQAFWDGNPVAEWPPPISELKQRPWAPEDTPVRHGELRSIVSGQWHYLEYDGTGPQLFDLRGDPAEAQDLLGGPETATLVGTLQRQLQRERVRSSESRSSELRGGSPQ
jgi:arylsulfatase A-like enzyme